MNDIYEELIKKIDSAKFKYSEIYFYLVLNK